jgi:hypothetical protein
MFGWESPLSDAQTAEIAGAKRVIYDGFLAALAGGVPREKAGILVDEQFGASILHDATSRKSSPPARWKKADRPNSTLNMARISQVTLGRSIRPSAKCWCATTQTAIAR